MSETTSITSGIAGRYATALFSICEEERKLKSLQNDLDELEKVIEKSEDFCSFIRSPIYGREQQEGVISSLATHLKLSQNTKNLLCLLARKGRMFILPDFIDCVRLLLNNERNEMGVEVISSGLMTKPQISQLEKKVSQILSKKAKIQVQIDKSLIGGMIIKLGSKMIDTSTKSKLLKLQTLMKEVN